MCAVTTEHKLSLYPCTVVAHQPFKLCGFSLRSWSDRWCGCATYSHCGGSVESPSRSVSIYWLSICHWWAAIFKSYSLSCFACRHGVLPKLAASCVTDVQIPHTPLFEHSWEFTLRFWRWELFSNFWGLTFLDVLTGLEVSVDKHLYIMHSTNSDS